MRITTRWMAATLAAFALAATLLAPSRAAAAEPGAPEGGAARSPKARVFAEAGLGVGGSFFLGDTAQALRRSYGGTFDPGLGSSLMMGFAVAPEAFRGVGLGARIKGTFGSPVKGEQGDEYIFNGYALSLVGKFYPLTATFGDGPYVRLAVGFGQMTTKRQNEAARSYRHQYAIGLTLAGALGYTLPLGPVGLGLEVELEYSNRNGTVDGVGSATFASGHLGGNAVVSF